MAQFNAQNAQVHVFTEKEGMLSAMAHDLEFEVTDFTVAADDTSVQATLHSGSMKVLHALKHGQPTTALSDKDKADIGANLSRDVLKAGEIKFVSTSVKKDGAGATIEGNLTLNGRTKPIRVAARLQGAHYVAEIALNQPDFGIKPFSALLGSLKVKPVVKVRVTLPKW